MFNISIERMNKGLLRTYITPYRDNDAYIVCPYYGIHAITDIRDEEPGNDSECGDIACSPMPWKGYEDEKSRKECTDWKLEVHGCRRWKAMGRREAGLIQISRDAGIRGDIVSLDFLSAQWTKLVNKQSRR